ncbi:hypothetical protein [Streptomyces sp. TRM64462]|uniref:hypothetical protein n=1 Tax=Streptomyces sp. TRM64462 TaxID=2741726 RepID=UPI001585DF09|nr:hypothetical protein [Streptomyces sp. TRM64462]
MSKSDASNARSPRSPRRYARRVRVAAGFAVLLSVVGYVAVRYETGGRGAPGCTVGSGGHTYHLTPEQAGNAATISAVGTSKGMPERAVTIALATALQESALRNIEYGDRDSLGLFQQRPSQGWGTERQIMDPVYSAGAFYDHLAKVPGYSRLPLTVAAQRVQRSGFPQAYAKHEPDAALLAAALTGRAPASLTCTTLLGSKTGDVTQVRKALARSFGTGVLGADGAEGTDGTDGAVEDGKGSAGGGSGTGGTGGTGGTESGSPAPDGSSAPRAADVVTVPVPAPVGSSGPEGAVGDTDDDGRGSRRGWEVAQWAVAQAETLRLTEVAYAGRVWSARLPALGWREVPSGEEPAGTTDVVIRVAR